MRAQLLGQGGHGLHPEGFARTLKTQKGREQDPEMGLRVSCVGISLATSYLF